MGGRFAFFSNFDDIQQEFDVKNVEIDAIANYNVYPSQNVVCIVKESKQNELVFFRWGLIPSWSKNDDNDFKLINARSETVHKKKSFADAFKKRRCIVIANGFFEWKTIGTTKIPMYITKKDRAPIGFAGIWETWKDRQGKNVKTCAILTTEANAIIKPFYDRMPAILNPADYDEWLDNSKYVENNLLLMLQPYNADTLETWEVSKFVNSTKNNSPKTIKPIKPTNLF